METIHLKTVDPVSQELLRTADRSGIRLNWDRYESQQPQDGFLRLGLSCPYGCLQGPCRIDPFGRGPDRGLCGLDRDGMAAALLLRLALQGVLESTDGSIFGNVPKPPTPAHEPPGGTPLSSEDIFKAARMLYRPGIPADDLIRQALRLGGLAVQYRLADPGDEAPRTCEVGYGLLSTRLPVIAVAGGMAPSALEELISGASKGPAAARVVSLGEWIPISDRFLPVACTSGEAELAVSSGRINLLAAGPQTDPALVELCGKLKIPVAPAAQYPGTEAVLKLAKAHADGSGQIGFNPDPGLIKKTTVVLSVSRVIAELERFKGKKIAVIGGFDTPQQPLGGICLDVARGLSRKNQPVFSWGDAALWMVKDGMVSASQPTGWVLDPCLGPLGVASALWASGSPERISGICFTGLKSCRDLSTALGLAASGLKVSVTTPLPVWGSPAVREQLKEQLGAWGGSLVHYDHPVQASEILDWFMQ